MPSIIIKFLKNIESYSSNFESCNSASLRALCPLNDACILVAALFNSGSPKSISSSSDPCKNITISRISSSASNDTERFHVNKLSCRDASILWSVLLARY